MGIFDFFKKKTTDRATPAPSVTVPEKAPAVSVPVADPNVLDCRGMRCPMPIFKIAEKIKTVEPGQSFEVRADDPAFRADLEAWCRKTGNTLVSFDDGNPKIAKILKSNS